MPELCNTVNQRSISPQWITPSTIQEGRGLDDMEARLKVDQSRPKGGVYICMMFIC